MDTSLLPKTAVEFLDLIGWEATQALCNALGGAQIRFGGPLRDEIARIVGGEEHMRLLEYYGAEQVEIPRCAKLLRQRKIAETIAALEHGATGNQAALAAGVTRRAVLKWRKAARSAQPSPQDDLFGG